MSESGAGPGPQTTLSHLLNAAAVDTALANASLGALKLDAPPPALSAPSLPTSVPDPANLHVASLICREASGYFALVGGERIDLDSAAAVREASLTRARTAIAAATADFAPAGFERSDPVSLGVESEQLDISFELAGEALLRWPSVSPSASAASPRESEVDVKGREAATLLDERCLGRVDKAGADSGGLDGSQPGVRGLHDGSSSLSRGPASSPRPESTSWEAAESALLTAEKDAGLTARLTSLGTDAVNSSLVPSVSAATVASIVHAAGVGSAKSLEKPSEPLKPLSPVSVHVTNEREEKHFEVLADLQLDIDIGAWRKLRRLLAPGVQLLAGGLFNAKQLKGLEAHSVLLLLCRHSLYLVDGFFVDDNGVPGELPNAPAPAEYEVAERSNFLVVTKIPKRNQKAKQLKSEDKMTQVKKFDYEQIREVFPRRYCAQNLALAFFTANNSSFLLTFASQRARDTVHSLLRPLLDDEAAVGAVSESDVWFPLRLRTDTLLQVRYTGGRNALLPFLSSQKSVTELWQQGEISNFAYLTFLNMWAGRSSNDLAQYPVFPWILADYTSARLDLNDPMAYRDLAKPMGAQDPGRALEIRHRFNNFVPRFDNEPEYMYGSHYSSSAAVLFYLIRLEPYTRAAISHQGGQFDREAGRLFSSVAHAWGNCSGRNGSTGLSDIKELCPEWFYLPDFLTNSNRFDFGVTQSAIRVDDVITPPWAHHDPRVFIRLNRRALESAHVSAHLHEWIDLIFGFKQRGPEATEALNVFESWTYEGEIDFDKIKDPRDKQVQIDKLREFGQVRF